jgi:hypothetical protein
MMSWAAKEELEAQLPGEGHLLREDGQDGRESGGVGPPSGKGQAPQVRGDALNHPLCSDKKSIVLGACSEQGPASAKEVPAALAWTHKGDERANLRTNLTYAGALDRSTT